jgi:hypothetical protein
MLVTIGDRVSKGTYSVHSRFRRVVNFRSGSRLVSVVDSSVGPGPVNIVAEGIDFADASDLRVETGGIALDHEWLAFEYPNIYCSRIDLKGADRHTLYRNLPTLKHALLEASSPRSLAFLLEPKRLERLRPGFERALAAHMVEGVKRVWAGDITSGVRMIAGCGFGLTPSGDDFICGMLVGLRTAEKFCGRDLSRTIETVYRAAETESFLSKAFLFLAYQGSVDARLKALVRSLALGDRAMMRQCAQSVISVGETSGADTLTGLYMTLERYA